jgi:hypothetical protein
MAPDSFPTRFMRPNPTLSHDVLADSRFARIAKWIVCGTCHIGRRRDRVHICARGDARENCWPRAIALLEANDGRHYQSGASERAKQVRSASCLNSHTRT